MEYSAWLKCKEKGGPILFHGPPGVGKGVVAEVVGQKNGYKTFCGDIECMLEENHAGFFGGMGFGDAENPKFLFIVRGFEQCTASTSRIRQLLLSYSKKCPIVCIMDSPDTTVAKICSKHIAFVATISKNIHSLLVYIARHENMPGGLLDAGNSSLMERAKRCRGDVRSAVINLEFWKCCQTSEEIVSTDRWTSPIDGLYELLKERQKDFDKISDVHFTDPQVVATMIHRNAHHYCNADTMTTFCDAVSEIDCMKLLGNATSLEMSVIGTYVPYMIIIPQIKQLQPFDQSYPPNQSHIPFN